MRGVVLSILPAMLLGAPPPAAAYGELTAGELARLERLATRWILELEAAERPLARPLTGSERAALSGHFTAELLDRARVREVEAIDNPAFYIEFFDERGLPLPIDFRQVSGLALMDTVLLVTRRVPPGSVGWLPLLFHELVHLAQAEVLGREGHVADYVRGWATSGFAYRTIPQEEQAYELTARFREAPERPFSVADEVARRFGGAAGEAAQAGRGR